MFGEQRGMRTILLGYENKELESYKEEIERIRSCTVCDSAIVATAEGGSYGELGYIARTELDGRSAWCYEFTKLCPNCFGEVNAVLRRIRKESRKTKEDTHAKN